MPFSWKEIESIKQFEDVLEQSKNMPALIFKYNPGSKECNEIKKRLESEWDIPSSDLSIHLLDTTKADLTRKIISAAGVEEQTPQVLLFADGVTMYDESHDLISAKKIKIALKIINRTFRWMETRV